jgi:mono/diheme cytochrome c family protein
LRYREAIEPGFVLRATAEVADHDRIERGLVCGQDLYEVGRLLFEHRFTYEDGLAAGRQTMPFRRVQEGRVGGPETTSCTSCHWRNGAAGGGGLADAAFLLGDGDRTSTADERNPPALLGAGVMQALGEEMTAELAKLRDDGIRQARDRGASVTIDLVAKGVSFGTLQIDPNGTLSTDGVRGVDGDLVVKPFGWKGTLATIAEFVTEAAVLHFGIQSEDALEAVASLELGGGPRADRDQDGVPDELTAGQITALAVYVAALEIPIMRPHERVDLADPTGPVEPFLVDEFARGRALFDGIGCASCHVPSLRLDKPQVTIRARPSDRGFTLDLARDAEAPRIAPDPGGGYPVFAFTDLKRHNLGDDNASRHLHDGIATRFYLTRPLWGVGDSSPYFYDGRSVTVDHAIGRHGGEAAFARDAWTALGTADRSALRIFLTALRRAPRLRIP